MIVNTFIEQQDENPFTYTHIASSYVTSHKYKFSDLQLFFIKWWNKVDDLYDRLHGSVLIDEDWIFTLSEWI